MLNSTQMKNDIKSIEDIFHSFDLKGSKKQILEALSFFEQKTEEYKESQYLSAIIKWHKKFFCKKQVTFPGLNSCWMKV